MLIQPRVSAYKIFALQRNCRPVGRLPACLLWRGPAERASGQTGAGLPAGLSSIINNPALSRVPVPPQKPNIVDERGKEVQSVAGPYEEGAELKLTCIVSGGE